MASPTGSPPHRRQRVALIAGLTTTALAIGAVPAFAHATFPGATAPGSVASPYSPASTQMLNMYVPYEGEIFTGGPNDGLPATTTDVKVTVPAGWTGPVCGDAKLAASISAPGDVVPGWTCSISTSGGHEVLHWTGPAVADPVNSAEFFTFGVTAPSPATVTRYGAVPSTATPPAYATGEGFRALQHYANAKDVDWKTPDLGGDATGLVRTVAAAAAPSPTPSPTPSTGPSPTPAPSTSPTPAPTPSTTPAPGATIGTQDLSATVPGTPVVEEFSVSYANSAISLTAGTATGTYFPFSGALNPITLKDTRTAAPAWALSGQAGDFTGLTGSARYLGWTPQVLTAGAGAVVGPAVGNALESPAGPGLAASSGLASAPPGHPTGTAGLGANLSLRLPSATPGGSYSSVLTLTAI
jgi:hypothetical protein